MGDRLAVPDMPNIDVRAVEGFGRQWARFDQTSPPWQELESIWNNYFQLFPWQALCDDAQGFDMGCGSGRWARFVAPRVRTLHCFDASRQALDVARRFLSQIPNCQFHQASVDDIPLENGSMDFGYALGVLHYVPDTLAGMRSCVAKLKPGAPFLVYLYYAFDNRPLWFRALWRASDLVRRVVSKLPYFLCHGIAELIALAVYLPMARLACFAESRGLTVDSWPLAAYRRRSFYTMRTDSLDRFGAPLEHRFTKEEIRKMMLDCGLERIEFSSRVYWAAIGYKSFPKPN